MGNVLTIIALLILNGFFVCAEFALVRTRRTRLEGMVQRGDPLAKIALLAVDNLTRMLAASQLGITLASLGLGWVAEEALGHAVVGWMEGLPLTMEVATRASIGAGIALAAATFLHVVLGELYPRAIGLNHPEQVTKWLSPPLIVFSWIARPFVFLFEKSARGLLIVTRQRPDVSEGSVHEADEIRLLVEQSEEEGKIDTDNAEMLDAVFEFTKKKARDVMTPRTRMVGVPVDSTLAETLAVVDKTAFSRYPAYRDTLDDITGVLLSKDLLRAVHRGASEFSIQKLMRPVHFVPGSREVEEVLADFKKWKAHLAVVLDEYGGTAGVVTMEDLIEELVGEILDEHDEAQDKALGAQNTPGESIVDGATPIDDVNDKLGLSVSDDEYATIGGFVFGLLGRLPVAGDRVVAGGATFSVRSMEGRRIGELSIRKN